MADTEERRRQRVEAGRKGGLTTLARHGQAFYELIQVKSRATRMSPEWKSRRGATGSCVHAWMSIETDARLTNLSKTTGVPKGAIVRLACETYLDSLEEKKE